MVPLDAVGLVLADVEAPLRDQLGVGRPIVRAVKTRLPALHTFEQSTQGGGVTTPALPVNHSPCRVLGSRRLPISVGGGVADGAGRWGCGARGAGARSTSRTASCAGSGATAAGRAGSTSPTPRRAACHSGSRSRPCSPT